MNGHVWDSPAVWCMCEWSEMKKLLMWFSAEHLLKYLWEICSIFTSSALLLHHPVSAWLWPLSDFYLLLCDHVCQINICAPHTQRLLLSIWLKKNQKKKPSYSSCKMVIFSNLFGLERRRTTSPVSLGGVGRVFMCKPPWAGQKTVCM